MNAASLTVLVTGATAGFGAAIARRFIAEGAKVIGTGRRQERLDSLREELGERFHGVCFDVSDREAVLAAITVIPAEFSAINVLVNNAGLALGTGPAQNADLDDWDTMIRTNVNGLLYCTHAVLPGMIERKIGHVVNIGSVAGNWSYPGANVYGGTKAFVGQFSKNLRTDLLGHAIRVTDIQPGNAETEFALVRFKGDTDAAKVPYAGIEALSADDIAESVFWVATLPAHVNINSMEVMPTMQAWAGFAFHRE
jgi:NADP-dependent 3-hydroxy acid dehydrogenase YdfG